ncbi:MAG: hypothetical protein FJZ96_05555 [Chloroflexi bacterium]|nr:hypothetical protein [Chloroflexota bacterium]
MNKIIPFLQKALLVVLVLGVGFAALPAADVSAAGLDQETTPPTGDRSARLAKIWQRELAVYERQGKLLDSADTIIERTQALIDKATEKGLDASAVQAALDAFEAAIQDARPIHQSANGIVNSHKGFDENGVVTDPEQALETVQELGEHLRDFRTAMDGTGAALKEAVKAFLKANRPQPQADQP